MVCLIKKLIFIKNFIISNFEIKPLKKIILIKIKFILNLKKNKKL